MVAACTDCSFLRYRSVRHDPGSALHHPDFTSLHFHHFGIFPGNSYFCISQKAAQERYCNITIIVSFQITQAATETNSAAVYYIAYFFNVSSWPRYTTNLQNRNSSTKFASIVTIRMIKSLTPTPSARLPKYVDRGVNTR